nr:uncharacterized protein [Tanacetum cinerariifolium]
MIEQKVTVVDEIKNYLNCRYLAPCEEVWRIFSFDIHHSYPSVMKLNFHLQNQQLVTLHDTDCLPALLQKEGIDVTMFTDWFDLNERNPPRRTLTYAQIPEHYVARKRKKGYQEDIFIQDNHFKAKIRTEDCTCYRFIRYCFAAPARRPDCSQQVELIIWDEAPMTQKYAFEALDKTLRDILGYAVPDKRNKIFGGMTVLLGGDFRQILLVIPKGKRTDIVQAYGKVPAKIKDGEDEPTWIKIPETFLIPSSESPIQQIVEVTYPNFIQRQKDDAYLRERAILIPRNDDADAINGYMFDKLAVQAITYHSGDKI